MNSVTAKQSSFYKMQIHLLLFKKSNLNFECEKQIINGLMF